MARITIVDYGMANLRSVQKAFESVGHTATITADPKEAAAADRLVLPGVGAFRDAIGRLRETGLDDALRDQIASGRPFLGICLGLQLLFTRSFEDGEHGGLALFPGDVVRFEDRADLKVPHMGWNQIRPRAGCALFDGLPPEPHVYFVHAYCARPADAGMVAAETDYPGPFASAIAENNVYATQFHPEKSQAVGLRILRNFAAL